jgi:hypothetical protein
LLRDKEARYGIFVGSLALYYSGTCDIGCSAFAGPEQEKGYRKNTVRILSTLRLGVKK